MRRPIAWECLALKCDSVRSIAEAWFPAKHSKAMARGTFDTVWDCVFGHSYIRHDMVLISCSGDRMQRYGCMEAPLIIDARQ